MRLSEYSTAKRRELVTEALDGVLRGLERTATTAEVIQLAARRLETERDERYMLGRILTDLAPSVPEARQGSITFKRYGREMRPWLWEPRRSRAPDDEWTVEPTR